MRTAVAFLWLCAAASLSASEHRSRDFNGVTATFRLLNPSLRSSEPLKVEFSLHNGSNRPVVFRYLGLDHHIDIFSRGGERVYGRANAAMGELAATDAPLKPGETVRRVEKIDLLVWSDLAPGDYYLTFHYDLRLLPDPLMKSLRRKLHSNDTVIWDTKKYWFHVHR